jgi:Asp-tRNA(Asn)/Glu-tRNA(Gln) amidotransferase B subunit
MRCDVNVSVCQPDGPFGARVEIKNVNSVKFLCSAIGNETKRGRRRNGLKIGINGNVCAL